MISTTTRLKLLSLGDAGVGKSCLIKRHCEGRFIPEYITTVGVDYGVKPWYDEARQRDGSFVLLGMGGWGTGRGLATTW